MKTIADFLHRKALRIARRRSPDFVVGEADRPYLYRWWLIPRNRWLNVYLHQFLRDDDDRALHDHPWAWCSILIHGGYTEHTIDAGGIHRRKARRALSVKVSGPRRAHRIELFPLWREQDDWDAACDVHQKNPEGRATCWTIFITGPRVREWGFHCPERGWVPWQSFTAPGAPGLVGPGCEQPSEGGGP